MIFLAHFPSLYFRTFMWSHLLLPELHPFEFSWWRHIGGYLAQLLFLSRNIFIVTSYWRHILGGCSFWLAYSLLAPCNIILLCQDSLVFLQRSAITTSVVQLHDWFFSPWLYSLGLGCFSTSFCQHEFLCIYLFWFGFIGLLNSED